MKIISSHGGDITKKLLNDTLKLDDCFQTIDVKFERQRELGSREKIDKDKKEKIDKDKDWRMSMVLFIEELRLSTNIPLTILFGKGSILEIPLNDKFRLKKVIANGTDARTTAALLGHSSPALVMNVYANPQDEAKARAVDSLSGLIKRRKKR